MSGPQTAMCSASRLCQPWDLDPAYSGSVIELRQLPSLVIWVGHKCSHMYLQNGEGKGNSTWVGEEKATVGAGTGEMKSQAKRCLLPKSVNGQENIYPFGV